MINGVDLSLEEGFLNCQMLLFDYNGTIQNLLRVMNELKLAFTYSKCQHLD